MAEQQVRFGTGSRERGHSRAGGSRAVPSGARRSPSSVGFLAVVLHTDAPPETLFKISVVLKELSCAEAAAPEQKKKRSAQHQIISNELLFT